MTLVLYYSQALPPRADLILRVGDVVYLLGVDDEPPVANAFTRP